MTIEHSLIPNAGLHELKGADSAVAGQIPVADGVGGSSWQTLSTGTSISFADYNDAATSTTPINVTGGAGYVYITNDALGPFTRTNYLDASVNGDFLWDASLNKFDWAAAGLELGDMVDIRLDLVVTTTGANQDFDVMLEMATDGSSYDIKFSRQTVKTVGAADVNRFNSVYMGDTNTLNNRARFKIQSDANATVVVNGWYLKVLKN